MRVFLAFNALVAFLVGGAISLTVHAALCLRMVKNPSPEKDLSQEEIRLGPSPLAIPDGALMIRELKYPQWQGPLQAAILEFTPQHLCEKVAKAEEAISSRIQELLDKNENQDELQALADGLATIQILKKELSGFNKKGEAKA